MRGFIVILALGALTAPIGDVRGQAAETDSLEGVVTLVDAKRKLLVIQNEGLVRAVKLDGDVPHVQSGERISIAGRVTPYFCAFPDYPAHPSGSGVAPAFKAPADWDDHFVSRLRGFLRAPADGHYTFWVTADDEAELRLGTNSDAASPRLVASVRRATRAGQWDLDPEQKSHPVYLKAGQPYYIEALQREWRGHDHLAVAWQGPTFEREIIGGEHLSPWPAGGSTTNGLLYEFWTNCFITRLALLSPGLQDASLIAVTEARVKSLGPSQMPTARRVRIDGTHSDTRNYSWLEVEGTASFVAADDGILTLELRESNARSTDAGQRMLVHVLNWGKRPVTQLMKRHVRAHGVFERTLEARGGAAAGILWVQDPRHLWQLNFAATDSDELEAVPMFDLTPANLNLGWERKVLVRGTVMNFAQDTGAVLLRGEDTFYAFSSSDGKNWTSVGMPMPVAMSDSILAGLAASSLTPTQGTAAIFDQFNLDSSQSRSVGLGGDQAKGSVTFSNGAMILQPTSGSDWDKTDQGMFFFQPLLQEGEIVAKLESFMPTRISDKAGLMMRESLNPDAPYVALVMTHGTRLDLLYRQSRSGAAKAISRAASEVPRWMRLVRRRHTLAAQLMDGELLRAGQQVELVGLLNWTNGEPVLAHAYVRSTATVGQTPPAAAETREVQIADLPSSAAESEQSLGESYLIRGVVTFMGRAFGRELLFLQDESGAASIRASPVVFRAKWIEPGRLLEAKGDVQFSPGIPPFRLSTSAVLGWGGLPRPVPYPDRSAAKMADSRWVEAKGIVQSVTNNLMRLMERNGLVLVWVGGLGSSHALVRYVDCLVTVRGAYSMQVAPDPVLLTPSPRFIEVAESAPEDPFIIPSFPINKVCASDVNASLMHRTKVTGVVTYRDEHTLVVQDQTGGARVLGGANGEVRVGNRVEVVGFANLEGEAVTLRESVVRRIGDGHLPEPVEMMFEGLLDGRLNCWLVRAEGILLDQKTRQGRRLLELQNGQRVFEAVLAESAGQLKPLPIGSRVQVTGVTQLQIASHSPGAAAGRDHPLVASMDVLMRTPADMVLLERPPWWTWRHTASVGALLVAILAGAFGWIRALRRRVAQRTSELEVAMGRLQKETELSATLAERERLAAEIHDTLEQGLSGIMMQLDGVDSRLTSDAAGARQNLEMARRMVRFSRAEVRHSLWNLESQLLKDGDLGAAIKEIARQMSAGSSTTVTVEVSDGRVPLPAAIEHHLLRCAQEAISNALKHSSAADIRVNFNYGADQVELTVTDHGCGFDPCQVLTGAGSHLGLRNLRSRARKIKGRLDIASEPLKGTTVRLTVPLNGRVEKAPESVQ
jgi:signal transduction histidine kinase